MTGLYIHIPYCQKACTYCDFHFSTSLKSKTDLINAINLELKNKKTDADTVSTIYFGGGTPGLLMNQELDSILSIIKANYKLMDNPEITLETNPENCTDEKLNFWLKSGINRLSIGIQVFDDQVLKWMGRQHNSEQAVKSVENARKSGFNNISIDLMYGLPYTDLKHWKDQIELALSCQPEHISAYCLTVETKTLLQHQVKNKQIRLPDDDNNSEQFLCLIETLKSAGYQQYEVSNFSKPGFESRHNSAYWKQVPYLGFGPSAHSFDGKKRRWNISNNAQYIKKINQKEIYWTEETLSNTEKYNEYILTGLRTTSGISVSYIQSMDQDFYSGLSEGLLLYKEYYTIDKDCIRLNENGLLIADRIISDLFIVD